MEIPLKPLGPLLFPPPIYRLARVYFLLLLLVSCPICLTGSAGFAWLGQSLALPFLGVKLGVALAPPIWPINLSMHLYLRPLGATKPPSTPVLYPTPITQVGPSSFSIPPLVETTPPSSPLCVRVVGGWGFFLSFECCLAL